MADFPRVYFEDPTKEGPFGGRVAQGLVGLVLSNGLTNGCIPSHRGLAAIVAFLGISEWNFRGPIRIGDTIHIDHLKGGPDTAPLTPRPSPVPG